jgi:outer membrane receptor protein involved in Fe transport
MKCIALICCFLFFVGEAFAQSNTVQGTVKDSFGSPVVGARIEFRSGRMSAAVESDEQGYFTFTSIRSPGRLVISKPGFATISFSVVERSERVEITLQPAAVIERLTVTTGGEDYVVPTPMSQFSVARQQIDSSGSLTLDDVLRQVPGFTLFRRSGSLTANPTVQGVSLRGVGANGASRAIVLLDGIPQNSPFGSWVYWNRIPRAGIDQVSILSGAASDVFGSGALGGVVNINTLTSAEHTLNAEASYGSKNTGSASFDFARRFGGWYLAASGQALRTSGYIQVEESQRGLVDTPASTSDATGWLTLSRDISDNGHVFVRANLFGETRHNGTPLQTNNTRISEIDGGFDIDEFSFRLFGSQEVLNQTFTAIAADRNSETPTNKQRNPSWQFGATGQWRHLLLHRHSLVVGGDARYVRGHSAEEVFNSNRVTANVDSGGRQTLLAVFGQDTFQLKHGFFITLGGRLDTWANSQGFAHRVPIAGAPILNNFADHRESAFSPRASVLRTFTNGLSVSASFHGAFRAPTLNELYRGFRVGNVVTNANSSLKAERLTGVEAGISSQHWEERVTWRANFFWNHISEPITNVTLSATPALITRQRQNLGGIRANGLEVSGEVKLTNRLKLSSEYLLTNSVFSRSSASAFLEGNRIPQVPKNQAAFQVNYIGDGWNAGFQGRYVGMQFEDDQNQLPLNGFFTADAQVARRLSENLSVFIAAQNLTAARYEVGRTPVLTIGPPLLFRAGVRVQIR